MLARALARVRVRRGSTAHGLDDELAQLRPGGKAPRRCARRRRRARPSSHAGPGAPAPPAPPPRAAAAGARRSESGRRQPQKGAGSTGPAAIACSASAAAAARPRGPVVVVVVAGAGGGVVARKVPPVARGPGARVRSRLPASARRRRRGRPAVNVPSSAGSEPARRGPAAPPGLGLPGGSHALSPNRTGWRRGRGTSSSSAAAAASRSAASAGLARWRGTPRAAAPSARRRRARAARLAREFRRALRARTARARRRRRRALATPMSGRNDGCGAAPVGKPAAGAARGARRRGGSKQPGRARAPIGAAEFRRRTWRQRGLAILGFSRRDECARHVVVE